MNIAQDLARFRKANIAEKLTSNPNHNTVVPLAEARKRVVNSLGEITRRKTEDKDVVELIAAGNVIGSARAVYKTKTQRTWTLTIGQTVLTGQHTISKALRAYDEVGV